MKVLILEPIGSGAALVNSALELGWDCYILSYNKSDRRLPNEDAWKKCTILEVDTNKTDAVFDLLDNLNIVFDVIVSGNEYYVPLSIILADKYKVIGLPYDMLHIVHDKLKMREFLTNKNIRNPWFTTVSNVSDIKLNKQIHYPCIIKPKAAAGSYHVNKANNEQELIMYYNLIKNEKHKELDHELGSEALVEEYLELPEYSVEGYYSNQELHIVSITKKFLSDEPYFVEIGHMTPFSDLSERRVDEIKSYVEDILLATNVSCGVFHCEIRFNKDLLPVLVEIAFRLPGDKIVDLIKLSSNIDLSKAMLLSYAGLPYVTEVFKNKRYAGVAFYHDKTHLQDYRHRKGYEIIVDNDEEKVLNKMKKIWE